MRVGRFPTLLERMTMQVLSAKDLSTVFGGDRWGDGQDQKNHPAPEPAAEEGLGNLPWVGIIGAVLVKFVTTIFR